MKYQKLGKTDITVSRVCMGGWAIEGGIEGGKVWGPQTNFDSIRTIHAAIDEGINFFDTAEIYAGGRSEKVLGKAVSGRRQDIVIGTKASSKHLSRQKLIRACEASLRRLRTDYIDLYYIHGPNPQIPISETLKTLEKLKAEGKIRAIGVSNFRRKDLQELLTCGQIEVNQLPYSLLWRAIEYEILSFCRENEVGVTCYSPLAKSLLTGKFSSPEEVPEERACTRHFSGQRPLALHGEEGAETETFTAVEDIRDLSESVDIPMTGLAIGWLLAQKGVISAITGARNPEQIRQNVHNVDVELSSDIVARLTSITEELKQKLGSNIDMHHPEPRIC